MRPASPAPSHPAARTAALLLIALAITFPACTTGPSGSQKNQPYLVNTQRTQFYTFGPAQTTGPDLALYHGQHLTMLSRAYGYSFVSIPETGQSGYVPTDDLIPAPPAPKPTPTPRIRGGRRHTTYDTRPPTQEELSKLPLPEFPESMPPPDSPKFRY